MLSNCECHSCSGRCSELLGCGPVSPGQGPTCVPRDPNRWHQTLAFLLPSKSPSFQMTRADPPAASALGLLEPWPDLHLHCNRRPCLLSPTTMPWALHFLLLQGQLQCPEHSPQRPESGIILGSWHPDCSRNSCDTRKQWHQPSLFQFLSLAYGTELLRTSLCPNLQPPTLRLLPLLGPETSMHVCGWRNSKFLHSSLGHLKNPQEPSHLPR